MTPLYFRASGSPPLSPPHQLPSFSRCSEEDPRASLSPTSPLFLFITPLFSSCRPSSLRQFEVALHYRGMRHGPDVAGTSSSCWSCEVVGSERCRCVCHTDADSALSGPARSCGSVSCVTCEPSRRRLERVQEGGGASERLWPTSPAVQKPSQFVAVPPLTLNLLTQVKGQSAC